MIIDTDRRRLSRGSGGGSRGTYPVAHGLPVLGRQECLGSEWRVEAAGNVFFASARAVYGLIRTHDFPMYPEIVGSASREAGVDDSRAVENPEGHARFGMDTL